MKYLYIVNRDCSNIKRVPEDRLEKERISADYSTLHLRLKSGNRKRVWSRFIFDTFDEAKDFANQTLQKELDKFLKAVNKRRTAQSKVTSLTELDLD